MIEGGFHKPNGTEASFHARISDRGSRSDTVSRGSRQSDRLMRRILAFGDPNRGQDFVDPYQKDVLATAISRGVDYTLTDGGTRDKQVRDQGEEPRVIIDPEISGNPDVLDAVRGLGRVTIGETIPVTKPRGEKPQG